MNKDKPATHRDISAAALEEITEKTKKSPPYAGAPGAPVIPKKNALIILSVAVTLALVFRKRFTCEHDHCHWQVPGTCQT